MPVFLRILDTISTPLPPVFNFLMNSKKTVKNPSKTLLIRALAADAELQKLSSSYIVDCIKHGREYQLQLAFWSSTSIWTMTLMKDRRVNDEDIIDRFISDISDVIPLTGHNEAQIAAYMILSVLGSVTQLSTEVLNAAIKSVVFNWSNEVSKSGLACVTQLAKGLDDDTPFEESTWKALNKEYILSEFVLLGQSYNISKFTTIYLLSIFRYQSWELLPKLSYILQQSPVTDGQLEIIVEAVFAALKESAVSAQFRPTLSTFVEYLLESEDREKIVQSALESQDISFEALELLLQTSLNSRLLSKSNESKDSEINDIEKAVTSASPSVEAQFAALKESSVDSFLDVDSNPEFEIRGTLFSSSIDRVKTADHLISLLKLKSTQIPSFLSRVWTGSYASVVRAHALKLLQAHIVSEPSDYQGLVPTLFVALFDESERVCKQSISTLKSIHSIYKKLSKDFTVWGLEDIFGSGEKSNEVKWMSIDSVDSLLSKTILKNAEEIQLNTTKIFTTLLDFFKSEEKTKKRISAELFATLASQAIYCRVPSTKAYLLRLVNVSTKTRSKYLGPLLKSWFDDRDTYQKICTETQFSFNTLESEVFNILTSGERNLGINFLETAIRSGVSSVEDKVSQKVIELWSEFRQETQLQLFKLLIEHALDDSSFFDGSDIFGSIKINTSVFESILAECTLDSSASSGGPSSPALSAVSPASSKSGSSPAAIPKRRRRSSGAAKQRLQTGEMAQVAERHLKRTTLVLEILEKNKPTGNVHILSQLFTILSEILSLGADSNLPVDYTQQVLANCMIYIVNDLKSQPNIKLDSGNMRIDILVSCIRTSNSQQVQNRFLLLVANMAPMASDIVLHSVMPIFTFMGANTIRQDDEFSAYVIQQTITQVIPALLLNKVQNKDEEIDFLFLSFVAAFSHIPRHRRIRLYSTLVKTLGSDTLHRLVFLLGEKYHDAKLKRKNTEAKALCQFSDTFIRGFPVVDQVIMISKYLEFLELIPFVEPSSEARKEGSLPFLRRQIFHSVSHLHTSGLMTLKSHLLEYLSLVISNEQVSTDIDPLRISIHRVFADKSLESEQESIKHDAIGSISSILKDLLYVQSLKSSNENTRLVSKTYYTLLDSILELLPIDVFVHIFREILLTSTDNNIRRNSLALVRSKFELEAYINDEANAASRDAFKSIVDLINTTDTEELLQMSFDALDRIVSKYWEQFDPKELLDLLEIAVGPKGINHSQVDILVSAVGVINSICSAVGARSIGFFSKIIPVLFEKFEVSLATGSSISSGDSRMIQIATFALVANLVQRLPAFMTTSLVKILKLVFISTVGVDTRLRLLESLSQHIDPKKLLSSYIEAWTFAISSSWDGVNLFLVSVDSIIEKVPKQVIFSLANDLVGFLLKAFEARTFGDKYDANTYGRIETTLSKTGLKIVLRLNSKTFRPLFVRMVRWGIDGEGSSPNFDATQRKVVFFKFAGKVFASLKSIVVNYYGYLLDPTCDILDEYLDANKAASNDKASNVLRTSILSALAMSFQSDDHEFWQASARFDKISTSLLAQYSTIEPNQGKQLVKTVVALAEAVSAQEQYKVINDGILKHLKESCSVNEKIWAIRTLKSLYSKLGEDWVPMLNPLVPIIAELLEDDDESVEQEVTKKLVPVVEDVLGESLDRYLT